MTDRAGIERLLNKTGRTLEGLLTETEYLNLENYGARCEELDRALSEGGFKLTYPCMFHQSDVIELLAGALRDALDKPTKKRKSVQFIPCVCGYNTHSEWYNCEDHVWYYECNKCGLKSEKHAAKTKIEARIGWNKMIEELKAGEAHD